MKEAVTYTASILICAPASSINVNHAQAHLPAIARSLISLLLMLCLINTAIAQGDKSNDAQKEALTVTAFASGERVRFTAPSSVVQMHLEVYTETAVKLFDFELKGGNVLDWHLQDGQAERIQEGSYLCVITVKNLSGRISQKLGLISVSDQQVRIEPVETSKLNPQQAQAVGPVEEDSSITVLREDEQQTTTVIAHNGEEGQITRGKGALSFRLGDFYSGNDREQMRLSEQGNLGIGVADPQARLDVDGFIRATQGIVFPDGSIQFSASKKTYGPQSAGPGQFTKNLQSGREHFETAAAGTGTQNFIAKWTETGGAGTLGNSIIFDNGTNVGIGTSSPAKKLDVRGGQIALDNSRFLYSRRTNGNFQEAFGIDSNDDIVFNRNSLVPGVDVDAPKASSALIFGTGAGRFMDVRNSLNQTLLRVQETTGNVGIGTPNPISKLHVLSGLSDLPPRLQSSGTTGFAAGLDFYHGATGKGYIGVPDTGQGIAPGEMLLFGGAGTKTSLWAGGARTMTLNTNGNVGIGVSDPTARLQVAAGNIAGIQATSQGNAIIGYSTTPGFAAIYGENTTSTSSGVYGKGGSSGTGVFGEGNAGVRGLGFYGVFGTTSSTNGAAVYGECNGNCLAGFFAGDVNISTLATMGRLRVGGHGNFGGGVFAEFFEEISDRNLKDNFASVDTQAILQRLAAMPIQTWNFKSQPEQVRHIGPMAQDFRAAFNLGRDDKHISTIDADGVALAAIQGLYRLVLDKEKQIEQLQSRVKRLERTANKRRTNKKPASR